MLKLGYKLMSEEHGPKDLVANAERADAAGFDFAAMPDHFFPWIDEQGHSPLAWSVLGAIAQATKRPAPLCAITRPSLPRVRPRWGCSATTVSRWVSAQANV